MEIVMMSRVLGLRLNAMLMEEWMDTAGGDAVDVEGDRLVSLRVDCCAL